jgi:hypothetical protein
VSFGGRILQYDGSRWSIQVDAFTDLGLPDEHLWGVSCPTIYFCFAVSATGPILRYSSVRHRGRWTVESTDASAFLRRVTCGANQCVAVGFIGRISRYDGTGWSKQNINANRALTDVSCVTAASCISVGTTGTILGYDGNTWIAQYSGTSNSLFGVACPAANVCFAVGQNGTILKGTLPPPPPAQASLWLGNDDGGDVFQTSESGAVLTDIVATPVTGIAFDGTSFYFSEAFSGTITQRSADGSRVLKTFTIPLVSSGAEDLAWDSKRQRLWRIEHNPPALRRIDPVTGTADATFSLSSEDAQLGPLGGLGVAYDPTRDQLYVSFCQAGCSSVNTGLVKVFNPDTGADLGVLFRKNTFNTGGLAFDAQTDTLWVGDFTLVRHLSRSGALLSSFHRPQPGGFVDGLEFIPPR